MLSFLTKRLRPAHKLLNGGAWFFIVLSLVHLAWVVGAKLDDPAGVTKLYSTTVGGQTYDAWGLTYTDTPGLIHAMLQLAAVIVAATATTLAPKSQSRVKWRRIGHTALFVWSAWWAMNLFRLAGLDGQIDSMFMAALYTGLTGCTLYRASLGWCRKDCGIVDQSPPETASPAPEAETLTEGDVQSDPRQYTRAFFEAIAPKRAPVESSPDSMGFDVDAAINDGSVAAPDSTRPSLLSRFFAFFRRGKDNVRQQVNKDKLARLRDKANHVAHQGHELMVRKGGRLARRARPVARTAVREAKNAWRKTIDALKDAEQMKTNEAPDEKIA